MRVGVLALQGGFQAHLSMLARLGHEGVAVRTATELSEIEGLVLPGGESTAMSRLIEADGLCEPLGRWREGPVLAICAGLILVARRVSHPAQPSLGWLDVDVRRNGYGRQLDSFEATSDEGDRPLVFIRAPRIERVGRGVQVLATHRSEPVLVRRGAVVAATFHPELADDRSVHLAAFGSAHDGGERVRHAMSR